MSGKANFRNIRPSFGESSASTSNPSLSTPTTESTSDPRRPSRGDKDKEQDNNSSSKRRRVPESVTRNACQPCKKARAKCDGDKPCKRCALRSEAPLTECVYEIHIKHAKEELVKQIKELRAKDRNAGEILKALSREEKVPEILERLRNGDTYGSIVEYLGLPPTNTAEYETLSPRPSQHSTYEGSDHEMGGVGSSKPIWSTVTTDEAIIYHLFSLYFAWIHPVHTLFSEGHFSDDKKNNLENYCSSALVNSICALACRLHSAVEGEDFNYEKLGVEFSNAARKDLDAEDRNITTIQAFAVLFLVDCAGGDALRASAYLRIATLALPQMVRQQNVGFEESCKATVRGIRNLNIEWAQMTFQVPQIVDFQAKDAIEEINVSLDNREWYFYRYASVTPQQRPSMLATTNREKSKLAAILRDIAILIYTPHGPVLSAKEFLVQYGRLMAWRAQLPKELGNIDDEDQEILPHVLYLLILHTTAIVQLLRPLLDFDGFPSALVEGVIWEHAQVGLMLLDRHYGSRYTFRRQPVLQMLASLQLADLVVRFFPDGVDGGSSKNGPEAFRFGLELLMQSRVGFPVAGPLQEMLLRTARSCDISLPGNLAELVRSPTLSRKTYGMDDFLGACTRPTYMQPVLDAHSKYSSSFTSDWKIDGPAYGFRVSTTAARRRKVPSAEEIGAQSLMQIRNLLNSN